MRKCLLMAGVVCLGLCVSCQSISIGEIEGEENQGEVVKMRDVQFVVKGLQVDYGTRATLASEGMTDLWVWEGEKLLCHQSSTGADFGAPTISLTIGAHDLTFVASKSEGQSVTNGVWSCSKVKDTFGAVLSYTVSGNSTSKQVQLSRINGKVVWTIEDALPADVSTAAIKITNQCYGLDGDLNGVNAAVYDAQYNVSSKAGSTGITLSAMVLAESYADGGDVSANIVVNGASGKICEYTNEVTVKANGIANVHGRFFSGELKPEVSLLSDWGGTTDYDLW